MKCRYAQQTVRRFGSLALLGLVLMLGACVKNTTVHPPLDVTFLPTKGDFISPYGAPLTIEDIVDMAKGKDYILIGEGHKNVVDHRVQQQLLAAMSADGNSVSLGLEMVAVDMQPILDDFGKGQIEIDALKGELDWNKKWGYPYSLFRGHFEIAQRNSLPVAGLNTPTAVTRKISKEGLEALTEEERDLLPNEIMPPSRDQLPLLDMIMGQHKGKDSNNDTQRDRFRLVQSIWDSKMAEEAVRLRKKYDWPVIVIAGSGHVEYNWGIARRIRWFDPSATILTIMPWRGGDFDSEMGDAFFYSPDTYVSRMGAELVATGNGGLLVEAVSRSSRAEKAGLRPGDILLEAAGIHLDYLFNLHMAGAKVHREGKPLVFLVQRGTDTFAASVGKLGQRKPAKHPSMKRNTDSETKTGTEKKQATTDNTKED